MINRILNLLDENKMPQSKLGELIGLSRNGVTDWKSGKSCPTITQVIAMSEIFKVSTDYILTGKEKYHLNNHSNTESKEMQELIKQINSLSTEQIATIKDIVKQFKK